MVGQKRGSTIAIKWYSVTREITAVQIRIKGLVRGRSSERSTCDSVGRRKEMILRAAVQKDVNK